MAAARRPTLSSAAFTGRRAQRALGCRYHLYSNLVRLSLPRHRARRLQPEDRWLVDVADASRRYRACGAEHGARGPQAEKRDPPFGSRLAIHIHRFRQPLPRGGRSSLHGLGWRRLRQRYGGELFRHARMRTPGTPPLQDPGGGAHGRVRLHRRLLQSRIGTPIWLCD